MENNPVQIAIGSDHAGFELKEYLKEVLKREKFEFQDYGTFSNEGVDYPDIIHPLARDINQGLYPMGVIICGSSNGVSMVANKYPGVRSACCWNEEITQFARLHNDANIIALPARFISKTLAEKMLLLFLNTAFEGGRHLRRVEKISQVL